MPPKTPAASVTLCAVGDVMPNRAEPEKMFDMCLPVFRKFDIRSCQLEENFTERGSRSSAARSAMRAHPRNAAALKMAGFDVEKARADCFIPPGFDPVAMIAVGYPGDPAVLPDYLREREVRPRERQPADDFVFSAQWGRRSPLIG